MSEWISSALCANNQPPKMLVLPIFIPFRRVSFNYLWDPDDSLLCFEDTVLFCSLGSQYSVCLAHEQMGNFIPSQLLTERITAILKALISWNYISQISKIWMLWHFWQKVWKGRQTFYCLLFSQTLSWVRQLSSAHTSNIHLLYICRIYMIYETCGWL